MTAKTIGIISIKGGVGKTSTVSALAASLAKNFSKKVLAVDANFSAPNLGLHLGIGSPSITLHHVLSNKANIIDSVYETEYGFHIIPGAIIHKEVNPLKLAEKLRPIKKYYDIILIDSSPTLNEEILATMMASDELYVVTTPDHVTLSATLRAIRLAKEKKTPIKGIILNRVYNEDFELNIEDIEAVSDSNVVAVLPHDVDILRALSQNIPLSIYNESEAAKEYNKLAGALVGEVYMENNWINKLKFGFRKLFGKSSKQDINRALLIQEF